jgi:hypothetical protein
MTNTDPQQSAKAMAQFADAMNKRDFTLAVRALSGMAMSDMLTALSSAGAANPQALSFGYLDKFATEAAKLGPEAGNRIRFAVGVVQDGEIMDFGLPLDEVNKGRKELGCTPLDDAVVQAEINLARNIGIREAPLDRRYKPEGTCCGPVAYAWLEVLVKQRQMPGGSLITNKAAAAHYMLARYHVCAARARVWQMKTIINGYDARKRMVIKGGDRQMKALAIVPGNPPFPPDFAIAKWAYKGAEDGEQDRIKCNSKARQPIVAPIVDDKFWGEIPRKGQ